MTVQETRQPPVSNSEKPPARSRGPLTVVLVAVVALLLGALGGWVLRGSESDPDAFVAGGGELSQRQEDMLDMFYEYTEALLANDGAAVVEMFHPTGTWTSDIAETLRVNDGSLEEFVNTYAFKPPVFLAPILVDGEQLLYFHDYRGKSFYDAVTFTANGEVQIMNHRVLTPRL